MTAWLLLWARKILSPDSMSATLWPQSISDITLFFLFTFWILPSSYMYWHTSANTSEKSNDPCIYNLIWFQRYELSRQGYQTKKNIHHIVDRLSFHVSMTGAELYFANNCQPWSIMIGIESYFTAISKLRWRVYQVIDSPLIMEINGNQLFSMNFHGFP